MWLTSQWSILPDNDGSVSRSRHTPEPSWQQDGPGYSHFHHRWNWLHGSVTQSLVSSGRTNLLLNIVYFCNKLNTNVQTDPSCIKCDVIVFCCFESHMPESSAGWWPFASIYAVVKSAVQFSQREGVEVDSVRNWSVRSVWYIHHLWFSSGKHHRVLMLTGNGRL